jgi:uncharacterized protein (DUF1800 family)
MPSLSPLNQVLGFRLAKHLLRRATFNYNLSLVKSFALKTVDQAVEDLLLSYSNHIPEPLDPVTSKPWINDVVNGVNIDGNIEGQYRDFVSGWWMDQARRDQTINHKMQWFLHSVFVTSHDISSSRNAFDYIKLIEAYALSNWREFAFKMSQSNLMLRYLDGYVNTRTSPNENYAREFMELFTITKGPQIGQGNYTYYTEDDVQKAAKLLTGWKMTTRNLGINTLYLDSISGTQLGTVNYSQHDKITKTFSPALGNTTINFAVNDADMNRELNDFVNMIFTQNQTAISYVTRLYRFFVSATITPDAQTDIILPLASTFRNQNYDIKPVLRQLLKSQHFYDKDDGNDTNNKIGAIVRSPLENLLQAMTFFNLSPADPYTNPNDHYNNWYRRTVMDNLFRAAGLELFAPENVAGYPAYYQEPAYHRNWFNGSTLIARYKMIEVLLTGNRVLASGGNGGVRVNTASFVRNSGHFSDPANSTTLVNEFLNYLLPEAATTDRQGYFLGLLLDNLSPINWANEWNAYISTNVETSVRIALDRLVKGLFSSQEIQIG